VTPSAPVTFFVYLPCATRYLSCVVPPHTSSWIANAVLSLVPTPPHNMTSANRDTYLSDLYHQHVAAKDKYNKGQHAQITTCWDETDSKTRLGEGHMINITS
jgi:hypothetical protein